MANREEAGKLLFTVDLYKQALHQLEFLKAIENAPELRHANVLKRAVYRYEKFWLPLAADHPDECLVAPLDIEWVWHCHMLSPVAYERDCDTVVGITINHTLHSQASFSKKQDISREYWFQKYGDKDEPFFEDSSTIDEHDLVRYNSKFTYDIIAAASRQAAFYYQVSLPHYKDKKFLEHSILRYKQFLYLKTRVEQDFLVPCYDIDIIWHTHQLNPIFYKEDMVRIIGYLFNHDDDVNERSKDSKLVKAGKKTSENWSTFYGERFSLPGAMYRGKPPQGRLHNTDDPLNINFDKEYASVKKTIIISLDKLTLTLPPEDSNRYRGIKLIGTICQKFLIVRKWFSIERRATISSETATSIEMTDVGHDKLDTDSADNLRFELFCLVGLACCKSELFAASGTLNLMPILNEMQFAVTGGPIKEKIKLGDNISLDVEGRFWNPNFEHDEKIQLLLRKTVSLAFEIGQYKTVLIPEDIQQLFGPVALESRPESASNICQTATHRYRNTLSRETIPFEVIFFHSQPLLMSVIQVICNNKMVSVAHLVSSDQLPLPTQVSNKNGVTLNPKQGERAVLIKNNEGDWGIVIGKWKGFKRGIKGNLCDRAAHGKPGKLTAKVYKFSSSKIMQYEYYKRLIAGFDVSMDSGNIHLDTTKKEIAEHIALVFAVSLLNVLCVPRPDGYKDGQNVEPSGELLRGEKMVSVAITDNMQLMVASGLHTNTPSNNYISSTFGNMTCSMCGGKVIKCEADDWEELPGEKGEDPNRNGCGCGGSNPMNHKEFLSGMVGAGCGGCGGRKCRSECGGCGGSGKYCVNANYSKSHKAARSDRGHAGTETKNGTGDSSSFAVDHLHISVLDYDSGGGGDSGGCDTSSGFD